MPLGLHERGPWERLLVGQGSSHLEMVRGPTSAPTSKEKDKD